MNLEMARLFGFRISRLFVPRYLHILTVKADFPLTRLGTCPADNTPLRTLVTLVGNDGAQKIRIGCCQSCGYIGYIDTPTPQWLETYYADTWDEAQVKRKHTEREVAALSALPGKLSPMGLSREELESLGIDKNRPILEIGGGLDRVPKGLQEIGFHNIVTVDASKHRAATTSKAFDIDVVPYPSEHPDAQKEFQKRAPFSLIYSSHVIEHMHNPDEVIRLCSTLQKEGDYLVFALPNVLKGVASMTLLYISHLHDFTPFSFASMLGKHGYRVLKITNNDNKNIFVLAQKTGVRVTVSNTEKHDYFNETLEKVAAELDLGKKHESKHRLWWWLRTVIRGGTQYPLWSTWLPIQWLQYYFYSKVSFKYRFKNELIAEFGEHMYRKNPVHCSAIMGASVRDIKKRYTDYDESPIEIQFDGNIAFFYK